MAGDDPELIEVCEELDRLLLHMMSELETLQRKRVALNELVEQGWFSLSQSRYAMGNKGVSSLQYGSQMEPLVRVSASFSLFSLLGSASEDGSCQFQVERITSTKQETADAPYLPIVEDIGPRDQVLRKRKGPVKTEEPTSPEKLPVDEAEPSMPGKAQGIKEAERVASQDPLKWFGILVPQSLRRAQNSFKQGLDLAVEVAELQSSIETTRIQYRTLLAKKQLLLIQGN
ncbi:coiled-coil domain-containing protein 115 isoform X1 [Pleurodeles waltl]|uniref:coiled-coil domain-containing protein 115 isoform X1 n=1 Tax=Pleurodeles waltl TaxID=8319 RepID=UPI0037094985